jgi:eukaryotic-like serine/threonine-protein kinase
MAQRTADERRTSMGLGNPPDLNDEDGEQVHDEELMGPSDTEHPQPDPRLSSPRISQRLPRLMMGGGSSEGDILVNRYRVERVLSRSAHEVVIEASHLDLGQRVLLRHLSTLASTSPEAVARFQRGARKAREMRSEHAERVVDFGRLETGAPYRAVELPRGPSLAEILRVRGALPVSEAVDVVLTACEPVAEAHASGVVHRSLSTANIFVERRSDGTPLVRVLDFGVSDPLEPDWANADALAPGAGATVEALRFASPEQIRNPGAVDARSDVWALGAILYELIAGAPLFQADSPLTLLAMIAADTPTPLGLLRNDVPPDLEQLVLSCLEKDPEARPRSVVDVVLALSPYASSDAQAAAARVARIVMRTTRPPPLPSHGPHGPTSTAPGRTTTSGRPSRALVRSNPPPRPVETTPPRADTRGFGMLFAGAAIGLGAAILAPRLAAPPAPAQAAVEQKAPVAMVTAAPIVAPQPAPQPLATQALAPATPVAVAAPTVVAAPQVVPVLTPVATTRPAPALAPPPMSAPARPAQRATAERAPSPSSARTADDAHSSARSAAAATAAKGKSGSDTKTASADDLFGGLD